MSDHLTTAFFIRRNLLWPRLTLTTNRQRLKKCKPLKARFVEFLEAPFPRTIRYTMSGWTLSDLEVKVAVANDLGQKVSVYIPSCFIENDRGRWSYHDYSFDWDANTTFTFSLSNAGVDQAFSDNVSSIFAISQ